MQKLISLPWCIIPALYSINLNGETTTIITWQKYHNSIFCLEFSVLRPAPIWAFTSSKVDSQTIEKFCTPRGNKILPEILYFIILNFSLVNQCLHRCKICWSSIYFKIPTNMLAHYHLCIHRSHNSWTFHIILHSYATVSNYIPVFPWRKLRKVAKVINLKEECTHEVKLLQ